MGWYTYSTVGGDETWKITVNVNKTLAKRKFRKYLTVSRIGMYTADTGTDCFMLYMLYNYPPPGHTFGQVYWQFALAFMLLPIIMTAIAVICDIITKSGDKIFNKILLVPTILVCSPAIPLYFLIVDAHDAFKSVPSGRTENNSAQARLNEALLEALPQAVMQTSIIVNTADLHSRYSDIPGVQAWQIIILAISVINFSFTVASSTYLFKAKITTRLEFFVFGLVAVTSRLMACAYSYKSTAILLMASISVWAVKRVCRGCCCTCCCHCCVPLAEAHRHCNLWSLLHVPITWLVTAYANCYTLSGLVMSSLTLVWSVFVSLRVPFNDASSHGTIYVITIAVSAGLFTFVANMVHVAVPKYRRSIGDIWLNKDPKTGDAQLY